MFTIYFSFYFSVQKRLLNDRVINNSPIDVLHDQKWESIPWKKLQVGDIVRVSFPVPYLDPPFHKLQVVILEALGAFAFGLCLQARCPKSTWGLSLRHGLNLEGTPYHMRHIWQRVNFGIGQPKPVLASISTYHACTLPDLWLAMTSLWSPILSLPHNRHGLEEFDTSCFFFFFFLF